MRRMWVFLFLVLAGVWAQPALADCPGTEACVYNRGCPRGALRVRPGQSIQRAIDAAPSTGAALCVLPGTYKGLIDFKGKPDQPRLFGGPLVTFLDGGGTGPVVSIKTAEGKDSILNGFTVRNGRANIGAGIFIKEASPTIRNSIVAGNRATGQFGRGRRGRRQRGVGPPVHHLHEVPGQFGGLWRRWSAERLLSQSVPAVEPLPGNHAPYGGAISVAWSGRLDLGWTQFLANRADVDGGGIYIGVPYGNALVRQVWFKSNTAGNQGGGMWVPAGLPMSSTPRSTAIRPPPEEASRQASAAWSMSRARCSFAIRRQRAPHWSTPPAPTPPWSITTTASMPTREGLCEHLWRSGDC